MRIKRIKIHNFKSFKDIDLEFGNFNVIVGANAAGKSNLLQIFRFICQLERDTLANAVSINGGTKSLINFNSSQKELEIAISVDSSYSLVTREPRLRLKFFGFEYKFVLRPDSSKIGCAVPFEKAEQFFDYREYDAQDSDEQLFKDEIVGKRGSFVIEKTEKTVSAVVNPVAIQEEFEKNNVKLPFYPFPEFEQKNDDSLLISKSFFLPPWERFSTNVALYDILPQNARNLISISGKAELEEDGKNLALILNPILEDKEKKRKLLNLLADALPFVSDLGTRKYAEKSLMITLKEKYFLEEELRADLLSDGTMEIIALLIILFFEDKDVVFIEEPERNIHPQLIARLIRMAKDASQKKQIFITTHSPEIVKHAGIENLLLVSRNNAGDSVVSRPAESEQVKSFLSNELGPEDLFVQNLLDI
jgi:predicted ATPase